MWLWVVVVAGFAWGEAQQLPCGQDQRVLNHECVDCAPGQENRVGDDPHGPNTNCDGPTACASHEHVRASSCHECPSGTSQWTPDNPTAVSLGFENGCVDFSCTRPMNAGELGFDLSGVIEEDLNARSFNVRSVMCAAGWAGADPAASNCASKAPHIPTEYILSGCLPCVPGTFSDLAGLRSCKNCHICHPQFEMVKAPCTATRDATCECKSGFTGTASSAGSASQCRPVGGAESPELNPTPKTPVDAYNLGTLNAHCQMFISGNSKKIAIIDQHMKSGKSDVPGFNTCKDYCAHYLKRRDATVCHGMCDLAGRSQFISGLSLSASGSSPLEACREIFQSNLGAAKTSLQHS